MVQVNKFAVVTKSGNHPLVIGTRVRVEEIFNDGVARVCVMNLAFCHVPVDCLAANTLEAKGYIVSQKPVRESKVVK